MATRLLLCASLTVVDTPAAETPGERVTQEPVTILHTNGLRGAMGPHEYAGEQRGGMTRLVHLIRSLDGPSTLILDGGDALGPHAVSQFDGGAIFARLMQRAGYDAITPGNHDLNYGADTLRARREQTDVLFLAANVSCESDEKLFEPFLRWQGGDIPILAIGVVSPSVLKAVHPLKARELSISDPVAAVRAVLAKEDSHAVLPVVVAHMSPEEALDLARQVPEVRLVLVGDNPQARSPGGSVHLMELAGGTRIVSTPERGSSLGLISFNIFRTAAGRLELGDVEARLLPVREHLAEDDEAARQASTLTRSYEHIRQQPLAHLESSIQAPRQFVADVMRMGKAAEVALINHGALHDAQLPAGPIVVADLDNLIRFNDVLVEISLSGAQLLRLAANAAVAHRQGQRLAFSGFDPTAKTIGGIPVEPADTYQVVTTAFLAGGGDGYLSAKTITEGVTDTLDLSTLVAGFLQQNADPLRALNRQPQHVVYRTMSKFIGALAHTRVNDDAARYADVAAVRGEDALAWNAQWKMRVQRLSHRGTLSLDVKSAFGQIRDEGGDGFREATDRLDAEGVYAWRRTAGPAPFVSLSANSVWTGPTDGDRPLRWRAASGLHRAMGGGAAVRLGLGWEHDVAANRRQIGVELSPELDRRLPNGSRLTSSAKAFAGVTDRRAISLQHYTAFIFALKGNLNASVDYNYFIHWDTAIERVASRSELQMGLTYLLESRRAR